MVIAEKRGVTEPTVSNWRKSELWQEFEAEQIKAYKQELMTLKKGDYS